MAIALDIALAHLTSRKRQTLVSLTGVVLGVAFFLAVAGLMRGSEDDFLKRLVDSSPHVTVYDDVRQGRAQPASLQWPDGAVEVRNVRPLRETRGIRGWSQRLAFIEALPGVRAAPVLADAAVLTFAGRQQGVTLSGVVPEKMKHVTTIAEKLQVGSLDALAADPNGILIGRGLADKFSLHLGSTLLALAADGTSRPLRVVGIFRTGNAMYDEAQAFVLLKRAQSLLGRENRVNRVIIQLADPYAAQRTAQDIETATGYKSVSWIEASEDLLSLLLVRNIIMYSVVAAILVVAAFGIYNTISTIVMEKTRDIAIMKSMGFHPRDLRRVFVLEGLIVGLIGSGLGELLGLALMQVLAQIELRPPGVTELVRLPMSWALEQHALAAGFAMLSCLVASYLPARRAGRLRPVDILRGAT
ncbi:Lipoprotein-releasing system transmembrane protein LolE [Variovorax sp. PBS-H4]|uniref:ABC transporter permease n=1 Tax=Variovorax sp. PBS-H4 TaxID=434008 RepID=UPI001319395D|nr:ABC transporter permease [Variovorax sp. PBS-H4]VTU36244.1 Lipoprotein-releasing system transmembrane protein LolE [Variovorax sp. PBS-H4]